MKATTSGLKKLALRAAGILGLGLAMLVPVSCGDADDCKSKAYYGPPPCQTDQDCIDEHGADWFCDKDHVIDEACGVTWPTCVERQ